MLREGDLRSDMASYCDISIETKQTSMSREGGDGGPVKLRTVLLVKELGMMSHLGETSRFSYDVMSRNAPGERCYLYVYVRNHFCLSIVS